MSWDEEEEKDDGDVLKKRRQEAATSTRPIRRYWLLRVYTLNTLPPLRRGKNTGISRQEVFCND